MKLLQDYHIHSVFSEDGQSSLEELCLQAIHLGIPEIGFCEHWDVSPYELNPRFFQPEPWWEEIIRLRRLFSDTLIIRSGVEIAEPHLYPLQVKEIQTRAKFDYIIGSVHWVNSHFMFDEAYIKQAEPDDVYQDYFSELRCMVDKADIDIVAHFDIPARTAIPIIGYDPLRYESMVKDILQIIIDRDLALEINMAGKRKPAGNLMPDPVILKWFAAMGGRKVTLGSDAHQASQVGFHLDNARDLLMEIGFPYLTGFEDRKHKIIRIQ